MASAKRSVGSNNNSNDDSNKKIKTDLYCICIDDSNDDNLRYKELSGKSFGDNECNIKFLVEDVIIESHSQVLDIFSRQRQLVRELIDNDRKMARESNVSEANIFQMSGTTAPAFRCLLNYLYSGKLNCDHKCAIDLTITALKLKFQTLAVSIARQFANNAEQCNDCGFQLTVDNVDDVYHHIAKSTDSRVLSRKCCEFMDKNSGIINARFVNRNDLASDDNNSVTFSLDKARYLNYIHFKLPDKCKICFNVKISVDRQKWIRIVNNELIVCNFWNWFYFKEQRVKYIRITHTDADNKTQFNIRQLENEYFLCKRVNMDLQFENHYLIPKHDAIKYPIAGTVHKFAKRYQTYCISDASDRDKEKNYYYHIIGDSKSLEFYLPQTCLVDSIRFRLWDRDSRTYDFEIRVKNEDDDSWLQIGVYKDRRSWQTISFNKLLYVRWISITGLKGPKHDPEFAVIHFECPPQPNK